MPKLMKRGENKEANMSNREFGFVTSLQAVKMLSSNESAKFGAKVSCATSREGTIF